jgi:hypothetical protein
MIPLRLRWCLFAAALAAMVAGASGQLAPLLSTALWVPALFLLACHPSSPVRRAVERGLGLAIARQTLLIAPDRDDVPPGRA